MRLGAAPPPVGPEERGRGAPAPPARPCGAAAGPSPVPAARWPPRPRSAGSEPGPPPGAVCGRAVNQPSAAARTRGRPPPRGGKGRRGVGGDCGARAHGVGQRRAAIGGARTGTGPLCGTGCPVWACARCDCAWPCSHFRHKFRSQKDRSCKGALTHSRARANGHWWFSHFKKEGLPRRAAPQSVNMLLC